MGKFVMTIDIWKRNYRSVRRQFWTILAAFAIGLALLFAAPSNVGKTPEDCLDEAICEYEQDGGHKIYPYGRACLLKKAMELNLKDKEQMRALIEENKSFIEK